jgi:hypothetical protein
MGRHGNMTETLILRLAWRRHPLLPYCHPVRRRPIHRGAGLRLGVHVERPTDERHGHPGAGLLGFAWVDGGRDGPIPEA